MKIVTSVVRWALYWLIIWPITVLILGISVRVDPSIINHQETKKSWRSMFRQMARQS